MTTVFPEIRQLVQSLTKIGKALPYQREREGERDPRGMKDEAGAARATEGVAPSMVLLLRWLLLKVKHFLIWEEETRTSCLF